MSFEGYYQAICRTGHLYEFDAYARGGECLCHECGAQPVWSNLVDDTNCDEYGKISLESLKPFKYGEDVHGNDLYNSPTPAETEERRFACLDIK